MINIEYAKKIGITCCADKLGREFVEQYANMSSVAFSEDDGFIFCFLGIDNTVHKNNNDKRLVLSSRKEDAFPCRASCYVSLANGSIERISVYK